MSIKLGNTPFIRQDFLRRFVDSGIKYEDAAKVYDAMVSVFADAVISGQKVTVGQVLSIKPDKKKARTVNMGFNGHNRKIHLGDRIVFKVNIFQEFMSKHRLDWKL